MRPPKIATHCSSKWSGAVPKVPETLPETVEKGSTEPQRSAIFVRRNFKDPTLYRPSRRACCAKVSSTAQVAGAGDACGAHALQQHRQGPPRRGPVLVRHFAAQRPRATRVLPIARPAVRHAPALHFLLRPGHASLDLPLRATQAPAPRERKSGRAWRSQLGKRVEWAVKVAAISLSPAIARSPSPLIETQLPRRLRTRPDEYRYGQQDPRL